MTIQTEILSIETSDFLKQIFVLKSFNSVFIVFTPIGKYENGTTMSRSPQAGSTKIVSPQEGIHSHVEAHTITLLPVFLYAVRP